MKEKYVHLRTQLTKYIGDEVCITYQLVIQWLLGINELLELAWLVSH